MSLNIKTLELAFAIPAIKEACRLAQSIQNELVDIALTKQDRSPVTVADYAVQAVMAKRLMDAIPGAVLVAEEGAAELKRPEQGKILSKVTAFVSRVFPQVDRQSVCEWIEYGSSNSADRFWTLDPIDGTKGFLRKGHYAVALALIERGSVSLGLLGCPNLVSARDTETNGNGTLVIAQRGKGCWTKSLSDNDALQRINVSGEGNSRRARILRSFESGHTNVTQADRIVERLKVKAPPVLMDSQAKYAVLASGNSELLFRLLSPGKADYREKIWDQAAGSIVVEESGGTITDLQGKSLDFSKGRTLAENTGILATNGRLHKAFLEAVHATQ